MALEYAIARDVRSALAPQQMQGQFLLALDGQKWRVLWILYWRSAG